MLGQVLQGLAMAHEKRLLSVCLEGAFRFFGFSVGLRVYAGFSVWCLGKALIKASSSFGCLQVLKVHRSGWQSTRTELRQPANELGQLWDAVHGLTRNPVAKRVEKAQVGISDRGARDAPLLCL